ncbi:MAG: phage tail tube protein [Lachnospiraceae bacterium]|nr:phage tail tube protein [Lachnospiraceae bacterium]
MDSSKRVINGTHGALYLDSEAVAEVKGFQAKISFNKTEINLCGQMATDVKIISTKGTGSVSMHKVNSRMVLKIGDAIKEGEDLRFVIISDLDDPDAYGAERISIKNVSFDDLTLADWASATAGVIEAPFTFTDYDLLDTIEA